MGLERFAELVEFETVDVFNAPRNEDTGHRDNAPETMSQSGVAPLQP